MKKVYKVNIKYSGSDVFYVNAENEDDAVNTAHEILHYSFFFGDMDFDETADFASEKEIAENKDLISEVSVDN